VVEVMGGADFDAAFPPLYRHAYRVAYRLVGADEAADLAQESLARAYARWDQVGRMEAPAAWVARVTTNLAFDLFRRRRVARTQRAAQPAIGPDAERLDVYRALAALPRRQRQVVVLRYLADQSEAATAQALGCSVGTVKQHASRGLAALRTRLAPTLEEAW
jgi:RNA polymerase sigma-70 factor (sigma-E family)